MRRDSRHVPPPSPEASPAAELRRLQAEQAAADWWQPGLGGLPEVHWQAQQAECMGLTGNAQVGAPTPADGLRSCVHTHKPASLPVRACVHISPREAITKVQPLQSQIKMAPGIFMQTVVSP